MDPNGFLMALGFFPTALNQVFNQAVFPTAFSCGLG